MPEIARRRRTQPPPPRIVHQALTDPDRDPTRPWLILREDEQRHGSTTLCWTLTVDEPIPDRDTIVRMRKRVNEIINVNLRFTFGQ